MLSTTWTEHIVQGQIHIDLHTASLAAASRVSALVPSGLHIAPLHFDSRASCFAKAASDRAVVAVHTSSMPVSSVHLAPKPFLIPARSTLLSHVFAGGNRLCTRLLG